jgi:hypothetical protein
MNTHRMYPVALGAILFSLATLCAAQSKPADSMTAKMPGPGSGIPHAQAQAQFDAQERCAKRTRAVVKKMPGSGSGVPHAIPAEPLCRNGQPL